MQISDGSEKMSRLIDADDFVHDLAEWYVKESPRMSGYGNQAVADMIWEFIKAVNKRPTIGTAPVVRCKDCKWKQGFECVKFSDLRVYDDDFCSRGEKVIE